MFPDDEFIGFVSIKCGVNKPMLIRRDIVLHAILSSLYRDEHFYGRYLFKGGTCLTKCYLGYYRFSVDLDFTFPPRGQLSRSKRRALISSEVRWLAKKLEIISSELGLKFRPFQGDDYDRNFVHFSGNENRKIVFFHLFMPTGEVIKIEVNFFEPVMFGEKKTQARTLLEGIELSRGERAYFADELRWYSNIPVTAYSPQEILAEKIRAILTRGVQKLRDFYDIFMLYKAGYDYSSVMEEALEKIRFSMKFSPDRTIHNLNTNLEAMKNGKFNVGNEVMKNELDLMLLEIPDEEFSAFINEFIEEILQIPWKMKLGV